MIIVEITNLFLDFVVAYINVIDLVIDGFGNPFCLLRFEDNIRVLLRPYNRSALSCGCVNNLKPITLYVSLVIHVNLKDVSLIFEYKLLNMIDIRFQTFQKCLISLFDNFM